jgi:hypothetical protein
MRCFAYLTLVLALASSAGLWGKNEPNGKPSLAVTGSKIPDSAVPYALRDFWLRFHELELCQEMRATFAFHGDRMEVWCQVENEKAFQRFTEMLDPLRISNSIELHVAEGPRGRRPLDEEDPPPSLWNNAELRRYFQMGPQIASATASTESFGESEPSIILEQRLIMFAEQTLNWNRKMRRYGEHLPDLVGAAFDPSAAKDTRSRAKAVCLLHADALDKLAEKLNRNLTIALPRASKKSKSLPDSETAKSEKPLKDRAVDISKASQEITRRIYLFINPQDFGVHLSDLQDPDLLELLKNLRSMLATFKPELLQQRESER